MNCPICGKEISDSTQFCGACGNKIPRCPTCGKLLEKKTGFCPNDGTRIPDEVNAVFNRNTQASGSGSSGTKSNVNTNTVLLIILSVFGVLLLGLVIFVATDMFGGNESGSVSSNRNGQPVIGTWPNNENESFENSDIGYWGGEEPTRQTETREESYAMPNCLDMRKEWVEDTLAEVGCTIVFEYEFSDDVLEGRVISQSIPSNSEIDASSRIVIVVSKGRNSSPSGYDQKVVVSAAPGSSYGTLELLEWQDGRWVSMFSCSATVGQNGISADYGEGRKRTPMGTFKLGIALSAGSIPNDSWPLRVISGNSCIVDDVNSVYYNTLQTISSLPYGTHYDHIGYTLTKGASDICIYIEHNGNGLDSSNVVAGKGSVITICGRTVTLTPTAGCVDISSYDMNTLISMLDYSKNPHIEITVQ